MPDVSCARPAPVPAFDRLPSSGTRSRSRAGAVLEVLLVAPLAIALGVPAILLLTYALVEPELLAIVADRPRAAMQVGFGLATWTALVMYPLRRSLRRLYGSRTIAVDRDWIRVEERTLWGCRTWVAPIASYCGVTHHVRTTLSGLRHELILVHDDPRRDVIVASADQISQATLEGTKALLGVPEVPATLLYMRGRDMRRRAFATPGATAEERLKSLRLQPEPA